MDPIGFDYVMDEPPLTKRDLERIALGFEDELEDLEAERDDLLWLLKEIDEKIKDVKQGMRDYGIAVPK